MKEYHLDIEKRHIHLNTIAHQDADRYADQSYRLSFAGMISLFGIPISFSLAEPGNAFEYSCGSTAVAVAFFTMASSARSESTTIRLAGSLPSFPYQAETIRTISTKYAKKAYPESYQLALRHDRLLQRQEEILFDALANSELPEIERLAGWRNLGPRVRGIWKQMENEIRIAEIIDMEFRTLSNVNQRPVFLTRIARKILEEAYILRAHTTQQREDVALLQRVANSHFHVNKVTLLDVIDATDRLKQS